MTKILLVQGANLSYLGKREPHIYGTTSAADLDMHLRSHSEQLGYDLDIFYTNVEGEAINRIYEATRAGTDGLVMNPAGFTYAGYALRDCVKAVGLPYIEVHISNVEVRGIRSVLSNVSVGMLTGFGLDGYEMALEAMLRLLEHEGDL
ncbi:type II 3-dehydroquinate dehydratase [uncultured Microbulbifer sp.]|nr:type II 3-dehydroquinate dehydratase [uncultured Microbulbifer sp.]